ncbi:MAG: hypothetical protein WCS79_10910 [Paludibacter sp.]
MKRFIQYVLLAIIACSTGVSAQVSTSKWQNQVLVIDGDGSDWGSLPRFFNAESNVQYEIRNDDRNLYLILRSTDRATQIQLLRAGFTIRFKVKSQPPAKFSIIFPPKNMIGTSHMRNNQYDRNQILVDKTTSRPNIQPIDSARLDGFQFESGIITSENKNANSICFAKSKENPQQTSYELQIPLRDIYGNDFVLAEISKMPIQLQVDINDLSKQTSRSSMSGRRGERGDRGMSGGMNGGMRGGGMNEMDGGGRMEGGEMGEGMAGAGEMGERSQMDESNRGGDFSMSRKSFNINFKLSTEN